MELAKAFDDLFKGSERAHGTFNVDETNNGQKKSGVARTIKTVGASLKNWQNHLEGVIGLGIIPINENNQVKWGVIDIDTYSLDIPNLVKKIENFNLPLVVCRSKSGGAHVFCFMKEFISAGDMQDKLRELSAGLGYGGVEIFPKQREVLVDRGDIGSWLNMPYFQGATSTRYALEPQSGIALTPSQFINLSLERSLTLEELQKLTVPEVDELEGGPPCLKTLLKQGFPEGTRNNGLFNVGVYLKQATPESWETEIEEYNRKFVIPPLPAQEVLGLISTLKKKDYNYKCSDEPIRSYCDVSKCRTCKFGVGSSNTTPMFSSLAKLNSSPPLWFLSIDDKRLELTTEQLQNQTKFQRACMEILNLMPPKMKEVSWQAMIQSLMDSGMEIIEVSSDVSTEGQFLELLESFCTDVAQAGTREEILLGKPFTEEGTTYFRIKDLREFLLKHRFTELETNKIASKLRDMKAQTKFWNIKGRGTNVWYVKAFEYKDETLDGHDFEERGLL